MTPRTTPSQFSNEIRNCLDLFTTLAALKRAQAKSPGVARLVYEPFKAEISHLIFGGLHPL